MLNTFRFDSRGRWGCRGASAVDGFPGIKHLPSTGVMQGGGRLKEKVVNVELTVELEPHPQSDPLVEPA